MKTTKILSIFAALILGSIFIYCMDDINKGRAEMQKMNFTSAKFKHPALSNEQYQMYANELRADPTVCILYQAGDKEIKEILKTIIDDCSVISDNKKQIHLPLLNPRFTDNAGSIQADFLKLFALKVREVTNNAIQKNLGVCFSQTNAKNMSELKVVTKEQYSKLVNSQYSLSEWENALLQESAELAQQLQELIANEKHKKLGE